MQHRSHYFYFTLCPTARRTRHFYAYCRVWRSRNCSAHSCTANRRAHTEARAEPDRRANRETCAKPDPRAQTDSRCDTTSGWNRFRRRAHEIYR